MATHLRITRDTSVSRRYLRGYKVSLAGVETPPRSTTQAGPVFNNLITYEGVFANHRDAVEAALRYIDTPCAILQTTDHLTGYVSVEVAPLDRKARSADGTTTQVLGSLTSKGVFLAHAA